MKNIVSFALIAIAIGLFFSYVKPEYGRISLLRTTKAGYEEALAKSKELKNIRDSLLAKYDAISEADKTKLKELVPTDFNPVKLIADIHALAGVRGMAIKQVRIADQSQVGDQSRSNIVATPESNPYRVVTISFVTSGSYLNFLAFLKDLEDSAQLVDVRKITISSSRTSQNTTNLDYGVSIDSYWIR